MKFVFLTCLTFFPLLVNALTCVDQENNGFRFNFNQGVLQGSVLDSETTEYPVIQYRVLKKKIETIDDAPEVSKNKTKSKFTRILKVEYTAPQFKLEVDYSKKETWKKIADTENSRKLENSVSEGYPATATVKGKKLKLYCNF